MCVIYIKYRLTILIIIIISLAQILLSYIANTSHTHTHVRTWARKNAHTPSWRRHHSGCRCLMGRWRPTVTELKPLFAGSAGDQWPVAGSLKISTHAGDPISQRFWVFFAYKKLLGRSETQTRDRMYCQSI